MNSINLIATKTVGKLVEGDVYNVESDEYGVPILLFWRKRLRDGDVKKLKAKPTKEGSGDGNNN